VADPNLVRSAALPGHEDELGRQERTPSVRDAEAFDPADDRLWSEAPKRKPGTRVLVLREQREPVRVDRLVAKVGSGADDDPFVRDVRPGVALERLADRCGFGGVPRPVLASRIRLEWRADRRNAVRELASDADEAELAGRGQRLGETSNDTGQRRDEGPEPR